MLNRPSIAVLVVSSLTFGCGGHDYVVTTKEGRLVVSPGLVDLDTVPVGSDNLFQIELIATDGVVEVLAINMQNVDGDFFTVLTEELPQVSQTESAFLDLVYSPLDEGFHWGTVTILTDEEEDGEHVIDLRGVADWASASVTPTIVDFGPVEVGEIGSETITFTNTCGLDVELLSVTGGVAPFAVDIDLPVQVRAGNSVTLGLTFAPEDLEEASTDLDFVLDADVDINSVELRGNACSTAAGSLYDQDGDGYGWCGGDCDDRDAGIHPGATELIDGIDNDCDELVDEGTSAYDDDGDTFSEDDGDCNDDNDEINPDQEEIAGNGIDDDCDGVTDSGNNDRDGDGFSEAGGDCDDNDPSAAPGQPEVIDGVDNDCDGLVDDETTIWDDDGDSFSEADGDCDDDNFYINPDATEVANWVDDDCNGIVDDGTINADDDRDGFSEYGGDCDDTDASINPGAYDAAGDGIDADCDGEDG
jgi:hypothetical protein